MKPRTRYGILDDFGDVVRWQWNKPSGNYRYVVQRVAVVGYIDWSNFEPAVF